MSELPPAWDNLVTALSLMSQHHNNDTSPTHCEHDVLYVSADPTKFSTEELQLLDSLGFFPSDDGEAFMSFYYGSA
jgi:hypothetical protein